jgi:xylulokinase
MSLGTSGTLFGYSDKPVIDPSGDLAAFCSSTGGWLPLLCTMNCTVASEEFRAMLNMDVRTFDDTAAQAAPGAGGVVVLPFFNGERTPNLPNGRASVQGVTAANFSPAETARANLARAALESAIFGMRLGLDRFRELGYQAKEIRLTGGGAKSPLWQKIACNVMNLPVSVPDADEGAALGAALQGLWCLEGGSIADIVEAHIPSGGKTLQPDPAQVAAYDKAYAEYQKYLAALSPLYK